ncbi:MAG: Transcriptional regulator, HxlR family [uncultured Paraburkholderia sp.]|nr:MAG: Transcriptional regulator, HxlR family [uncultured Paraburkholderia sp.]CAH2911668.1 MAG: Transcriptional regulator, HxlR family [uncultured Paraburkholderia sp.]
MSWRSQVTGIGQMITQQLRRLEHDGLVSRTIYPTVPPKVAVSRARRDAEMVGNARAIRAGTAGSGRPVCITKKLSSAYSAPSPDATCGADSRNRNIVSFPHLTIVR